METIRILIVEDREDWKKILESEVNEALNQVNLSSGYSLKIVETFSEASVTLQNDGIWNLLITDLGLLPEAEDTKFGKILIEQANRLNVPIIVVSGRCDASYVRYLLKVKKICDFFDKGDYSIRIPEFHEEIRKSLRLLDQKDTRRFNEENEDFEINYQDFQLLVTTDLLVRASSVQGDVSNRFRLDLNEIKLALNLIEKRQTDIDLLKRLGGKLYQAIFPKDILGLFRATVAGASSSESNVRIRLVLELPELASLPWELLYDESTNTFLANSIQTALSRYIDVPLQKRDLKSAKLPLKVLLIISSPKNLIKLDVFGEENLIKASLGKYINLNQIDLDVLHEPTVPNIIQKLREKPYNIFHFIGHGIFKDNKGYIALLNQDGTSRLLNDESFSNFFLGNRSLGLAILNSCESATISSNRVFAGIAPNLVRRGLPAVIAMQYSILDTTAKLFADEFYRTLALGYPIDSAIQTTRNSISIEVGLDKPDFAIPVLYMRAKDGIIFNKLYSS